MLTLRLDATTITIHPGHGICQVIRDGEVLNFQVDRRAPLDVANDIKQPTAHLTISGKITLMQLVCALMAANITIKATALATIHKASGSKFNTWTETFTQALAGNNDKLRFVLQQLVVPATHVVVGIPTLRTPANEASVSA